MDYSCGTTQKAKTPKKKKKRGPLHFCGSHYKTFSFLFVDGVLVEACDVGPMMHQTRHCHRGHNQLEEKCKKAGR